MNAKHQRDSSTRCEQCNDVTPRHEIVHYGSVEAGYRRLCNRCVNDDIAKRCGVESFEHVPLEPMAMLDKTGQMHEFHFSTRLLGDKVSVEAFELEDGAPSGYQFAVFGAPEEDRFSVVARLIEKMRRGLAVCYLKEAEAELQLEGLVVKGRIESDRADDRRPCVVVDGKEVSWDEFGRIVNTCPGWDFKLQIVSKFDEA